jgi:hypothetical protein
LEFMNEVESLLVGLIEDVDLGVQEDEEVEYSEP